MSDTQGSMEEYGWSLFAPEEDGVTENGKAKVESSKLNSKVCIKVFYTFCCFIFREQQKSVELLGDFTEKMILYKTEKSPKFYMKPVMKILFKRLYKESH